MTEERLLEIEKNVAWWETVVSAFKVNDQFVEKTFSIMVELLGEVKRLKESARQGGVKGAAALNSKLTPKERSAAARKAAKTRWAKLAPPEPPNV